jgi:hypothetical protein
MLSGQRSCWFLFVLFVGFAVSLSRCQCGDSTVTQFPQIIVTPENLVFSVIPVGEKEEKSAVVRARGRTLTISAISIVTEQGQDAFTLLDKKSWSFPLKLEPEETLTLKVRYSPLQAGSAKGYVKILSDARNAASDSSTKVRLLSAVVGGRLLAEPNPMEFGAVPPKQNKTLPLTLTNKGEAALTLQKTTFSNDRDQQFAFVEAPKFPLEIKPGKSLTWKIRFAPKVAQADALLQLHLEGETATYDVRLVGAMARPHLEVEPLLLVFRQVPQKKSKTLPLTLRNKGTLAVKITALDFAANSSPPFSLSDAPKLPLILEPQKERVLKVTFQAASDKPVTGALAIKSDDPNKPEINVVLEGNPTGCRLAATPKKLTFTYNGEQQVTLSNSGSSECELSKIAFRADSSKAFSFGTPPPQGKKLPPNGTAVIAVRYTSQGKKVEDGWVVVESNDSKQPKLEIPVSTRPTTGKPCEITISPTILQFGLVAPGKAKMLPVEVRNSGYGECTLKKAQLNDPFGVFRIPTLPGAGKKIGAGQTFKIEVTFAPSRQLNAQATLELLTDDPVTPRGSVMLYGYAGKACLEVVPSPLDIGSVKVGCRSLDQHLEIFNTCSSPLEIRALQWKAGSGSSKEFSLIRPPRLPQTLASAESLQLLVRYKPTALGADQTTLQITNSAPGQSPFAVVVQGKGVSTDAQKDVFTQTNQAKIDVLFVIDDSNSMKDKQQSLSSNLNSFMQWASRLKADYHIAVTTTDVDCGTKYTPGSNGLCNRPTRPPIPRAGCFRGSPKIITQQTPNALQVFANNVKVGLQGSGKEQGIEAAYQAFQPARLKDCNQGFLRPDATLSIIFVGDEPDSSPEAVSFYVKFFATLKQGRRDRVRASSVVGPPSGCTVNGFRVKPCPHYWDIATQLKGVQASICASNWASTLSQLGSLTFGLKRQFFLSQPADPSSITVKVNGKTIPQGTQGWTYDAASNSIVFASNAIPDPNAKIEVHYKARCLH